MSEEAPKKRGRPRLPQGMMLDVTLRMERVDLARGDALVGSAAEWREFRRIAPTRSGILRLAMQIGLASLETRKVTPTEKTSAEELREMVLALAKEIQSLKERIE